MLTVYGKAVSSHDNIVALHYCLIVVYTLVITAISFSGIIGTTHHSIMHIWSDLAVNVVFCDVINVVSITVVFPRYKS